MDKRGKIIHNDTSKYTNLILNNIDKISSSLREIILKLSCKAQNNELDNDTIAFLIYIIECLENNCIDLKDVNIEIIRNFMTEKSDRSKFLFEAINEKEMLLKEQKQMQLEAARYFENMEYDESNIKSSLCVKH